jgi:aspartyl/asparaginyl beta-hydroxylase (cupin superfamily)
MTDPPGQAQAAKDAAFGALGRGDYRGAAEQFARLLAAGPGDAATWFGMSLAQRKLGAAAEENVALERALALDGTYLPALIGKGDLYARQGDERAASSYYGAAIRLASAQRSLSPDWRRELQRVTEAMRVITGRFEAHLLAALSAHGLNGAGTERFGRALELLLGKRQVFLQQPKYFYFPELPQIQFYARQEFPWAAALESSTPRIRAELDALLQQGAGFQPYIQQVPDRPTFSANPLLNSMDWSAFYLVKDGAEVREHAARCPATMAALSQLPLCRIGARTPSILFSALRPGARIRPHHGFTNARLICHLPLIVPRDCALRVGNETHAWREGELVVFDDSMEHEAWNLSNELRVVLLFDVWRPELTPTERRLVAATLEAVSRFEGAQRSWAD